jgi:hypothetical protein
MGGQFNIEVIKDLPLIPSDLRSSDITRIYDLLGQVRDNFQNCHSLSLL